MQQTHQASSHGSCSNTRVMAGGAQVHPDVNPALRSTDDAVLLNEAYAVLQLVCHPCCPCSLALGMSSAHLGLNAERMGGSIPAVPN